MVSNSWKSESFPIASFIPIAATGRYYFSNRKMYAGLDLGYAIHVAGSDDADGGFYFRPKFGWNFGKVNLVEIPASSTAEIIAGLAGTLEIELGEDIANCLLAGIISNTNSFQKTNTTPNSFTVAASLMSAGANQQEIVRFLYKTKSLSVLKLWGRAMALLKHSSDLNLAWSVIEEKVFSETKTRPDDLKQIIKEIAPGSRDFNTIMFLWEKDEKFYGLIQTMKEAGKEELSKLLNGRIEKDGITFTQEAEDISQAEQNALTVIKQWTENK